MEEGKDKPHNGDPTRNEDLLVGLRAGDPTVIQSLLHRFYGPLLRYAGGILGHPDDAEEAVQEAFIQLWEKREHWRQGGSLKALLFTLTRNAAIDSLRKRKRERPLSDGKLGTTSSPSPTPFEDLQETELWDLAQRAVGRLPARRQEVFRLVREGGLSYREVAETLGISSQTVANLMSLALSDLRASLRPLLEADPAPSPEETQRHSPRQASGSD